MKVKVALKLNGCSNAQVLINGDRYVNAMTDNTHFTSASSLAQIAASKTAVANLRAAINSPTSDTKADDIKISRDSVDRNLTMLSGEVEDVANNPSIPDSMRVQIVHSAGMEVRGQGRRKRNTFSVKNTEISGRVIITAEGGANSHEWQYTTDVINFTGRIAVETSTVATIYIDNLKKGSEYAFFHKATKAKKVTSWEGPILLIIL